MAYIGTTLPVFIGLTVILFGWAAWMTGQAISTTWRPMWHLVPYSLLMAAGNRFLDYALFGDDLLSPGGYVLSVAIILAVSIASFRATLARKMVQQYPWLYERAGPFDWRARKGIRIAV